MALCFHHHPSAQIPEAKELSTRAPCPADSREHFIPELREPFKGLREGKKNSEMNDVAFPIP